MSDGKEQISKYIDGVGLCIYRDGAREDQR